MTPAAGSTRRILYVVNVSWFFLSHRLRLAAAALAAGYEVHVATRVVSREDAERIRGAGLVLHEAPIGRADTGLGYDLHSLWYLLGLQRRLRPDVVHLVTMKPVVFGGIAARLAGVRGVVVAIAGLGTGFAPGGGRHAMRRALLGILLRLAIRRRGSRVIFQNREDLEQLVGRGIVSRDAARLIPGSGVDPIEFRSSDPPPSPLRVVLPARMLRDKGVPVFIEAARQLAGEFPDARFILAGDVDPANPGSLTRAEIEADAHGNVEWPGHVTDMPSLLESCHVVCLPTWYGEGVPKALIEGAAAGRPLVTTDIPGCRDVCADGVNGILVPPRDATALAAALRKLLADAPLRQAMGRAGRERAVRRFGLDAVIAATLEIYDELAGVPRGEPARSDSSRPSH
ncbi:MAG: glycosyltransferase family 1 protein [Lysobacterales bacterium]|jgi:glycosyltransferase involved in cell wall biosynthesis|nr:MAG: glycosyltransferase family 1 protein [Xanthomonadales bacterium]